MNKIKSLVEFSRKYPPVWVEFKSDKEDKQLKVICEELWKINVTEDEAVLRNLSEAYRNFAVLQSMLLEGAPVKEEYAVKVVNELEDKAKIAITSLISVYKKHQKLNDWCKSQLKCSPQEIKTECSTWLYKQYKENK